MKHTRKIVVAICLILCLFAVMAANIVAASATTTTGAGMVLADYDNVKFIYSENLDDGTTKISADSRGGDADLQSGKKGVSVVSDETTKNGAPNVYSTTPETTSVGYSIVNYADKVTLSAKPSGKNHSLFTQIHPIKADTKLDSLDEWKLDPDKTPTKGLVMEFDIGNPEGCTSMSYFDVQIFNTGSANGGFLSLFEFGISGGKAYVAPVGSKSASKATVTATGKWIHIAVVYTPDDNKISVYAHDAVSDERSYEQTNGKKFERKLVASISAATAYTDKNGVTTQIPTVYPYILRAGNQGWAVQSGSFGLDNFVWYQSTTICNPQYLDQLTPEVRFSDAVAEMTNTSVKSYNRYLAYKTAASLVEQVRSNSSVATSVSKFDAFERDNLSTIISQAKVDITTDFTAKVSAVPTQRGVSNLDSRITKIEAAEAFTAQFDATVLPTSNQDYQTQVGKLATYHSNYEQDSAALSFRDAMNAYERARVLISGVGSLDAMKKHYETAKTYVSQIESVAGVDGAFDSYTANDKLYFTRTTGLNTAGGTYRGAWVSYKAAPAEIDALEKTRNTTRFINLVKVYTGTQEADWKDETRGAEIRKQWEVSRAAYEEIKKTGYDSALTTEYTAAETEYKRLHDGYFWDLIQTEHAAVLQEKLDVFADEEKDYIERAGACTFIDNYLLLHRNDVTTDGVTYTAKIQAIYDQNVANKALLSKPVEGLTDKYAEKLNANTTLFKSVMADIAKLISYSDLKKAFDESATPLYYAMNISDAEAKAAVDAYEALRTKLRDIETAGNLFLENVQLLSDYTDERDDEEWEIFYESFMICYSCEPSLDSTYSEVGRYKTKYDAIKADYIANTTLANQESVKMVDVMGSARSFCGIDSLVKFVLDLFK